MRKQPTRIKYMFWLDLRKDDEYDVAEQITRLKQKRLFSKTIRDGIRLILDLRAGHTEVLFELFPWVSAAAAATPTPSNPDLLQEQLHKLESLLLSQGNAPGEPAKARRSPGRPLGRRNHKIEFEYEPEITVTQAKKTSAAEVANNFIGSLGNLFG